MAFTVFYETYTLGGAASCKMRLNAVNSVHFSSYFGDISNFNYIAVGEALLAPKAAPFLNVTSKF